MEVKPPSEEAIEKVLAGICPSCGALDLHFGPRGGMGTNFACFSCFARFNGVFVARYAERDVVFFSYEGAISEETKRFFRPQPLQEDWSYLTSRPR